MGRLAAREPDDEEAKIFYALALNMVPRALDKDFARQTKATELLLVALAPSSWPVPLPDLLPEGAR